MHSREELRRLCEAATPGPWRIPPGEEPDGSIVSSRFEHALPLGQMYHRPEADAALIVAARNALPALLSELDAKDARIAELEAALIPFEKIISENVLGRHRPDAQRFTLAQVPDVAVDFDFTVGDFRRAAAALAKGGGK